MKGYINVDIYRENGSQVNYHPHVPTSNSLNAFKKFERIATIEVPNKATGEVFRAISTYHGKEDGLFKKIDGVAKEFKSK